VSEAAFALVVTTILTAAVHTLIPDHWLPFVLVARAERWSPRRTLVLTSASAMLHVAVSIALGLAVALGLGAAPLAAGLAEILEALTGWLLIAFGTAYMAWFLVRGGHVHSFGMHPHHDPRDPDPSAAGPWRRDISGWALALIVGFNPCILVIPTFYGAARIGARALAAVAAAFAVTTVLTMAVVTLLGLRGTARLTSPFLTRYGEAVSGGLVALTGLVVMLLEIGVT
jgi:hypothetical protein